MAEQEAVAAAAAAAATSLQGRRRQRQACRTAPPPWRRSRLRSIGQVTPSAVALAAIPCCALWAGERLVPHKVFTVLSLFETIKEPLTHIPKFVAALVDLRISAR
jgi:hypothetical protein